MLVFTAIAASCPTLVSPPLPHTPAPGNHWCVCSLSVIVIPRMLHKWSHGTGNLSGLAFCTLYNSLEVHLGYQVRQEEEGPGG